MVEPTRLINTNELKTDFWSDQTKNRISPEANFDRATNIYSILYHQGKERLIVHYIDYYVAVLYRFSDKEVVGIQIESFSEFFTKMVEKNVDWKLSESGLEMNGNDFVIHCEKRSTQIDLYNNVFKAVSWTARKEGLSLQPVLN